MELQSYFSANISILLIISTIFLLSLIKLLKGSKATKLPPGPWKLPIIGSMHYAGNRSHPHQTLTKLSKRYGPLMHLKLGEIFTVVASSPKMARLILKTHELSFVDRPTTLATDIYSYNKSAVSFTPYSSYFRQMRKICLVELLSNKRVKSFSYIRQDEVANLVTFIERSVGLPIDLSSKIYSLTSSVICRAEFGEKFQRQSSIISLVNEGTRLMGGFNLGDFFPSVSFLAEVIGMKKKLQNSLAEIDVMLDEIIQKRREYNRETTKHGEDKEEYDDLLDVLLGLHQKNEHEFPITDTNIKAVILDMFMPATETTAAVIEWVMSELIRNPRVMEKAQSELRLCRNELKNSEENDEHELSYLKKVIKETLRLHPPIPLVPRKCIEACEIDGYTIPVNSNVFVNLSAIGRDPDLWEDAEKFIPERFDKNVFDFTGNQFEYFPFGSGRRICPGVSFGNAVLEFVLSELLYHFNWKLPNSMRPEQLEMIETTGIATKRKNPLCLVADLKETTLA